MPKYLTLQPKAIDKKALNNKGYSVKFCGDYVHVILAGAGDRIDPDVQEGYWEEIRTMCEEHKCRRVFVEGVAPRGDRTTGEIIGAGLRTGKVPQLWLAYWLEGFHATELSALYETMAATRGVRVKFFSEKQRALEWLRNNAK